MALSKWLTCLFTVTVRPVHHSRVCRGMHALNFLSARYTVAHYARNIYRTCCGWEAIRINLRDFLHVVFVQVYAQALLC